MAILFTVITQLLKLPCILSNLSASELSSSLHKVWLWGGDSGLFCFPGWPPTKHHLRWYFLIDVWWYIALPQTLSKCWQIWQCVILKNLLCYVILESQIAKLSITWSRHTVRLQPAAGQRSGRDQRWYLMASWCQRNEITWELGLLRSFGELKSDPNNSDAEGDWVNFWINVDIIKSFQVYSPKI